MPILNAAMLASGADDIVDTVVGIADPNLAERNANNGANVVSSVGNAVVDSLDEVCRFVGGVNSSIFDNAGEIISNVPILGPVIGYGVSHIDDVTNAVVGGIAQEGIGVIESVSNLVDTAGAVTVGSKIDHADRSQIDAQMNAVKDAYGYEDSVLERIADEGVITGGIGWVTDKVGDLFSAATSMFGKDIPSDDPLVNDPAGNMGAYMQQQCADVDKGPFGAIMRNMVAEGRAGYTTLEHTQFDTPQADNGFSFV